MHQKYPTTSTNCSISAIVSEKSKTSFMRKLMAPLIVAFAFMVGMPLIGIGQTNNYFGTSGTLSGNVWSTNSGGPYTSALVTTGGAILNFNNAGSATGASTPLSTAVGINFGAAITWSAGGTMGGAGVTTAISVASGVSQNMGSQALSTSATAAFSKSGTGELAWSGSALAGSLTLNAGTLAAGGVNALGSTNTLTINGGTISGTATRDFTGKITGGITIGGDFTLGAGTGLSVSTSNLTFNAATALGSSVTRTITIGGTGTYTMGGVISGSNSGITVASTAAGILLFSGANTYSGATTINGGTLALSGSGSIGSSTNITVGSGGTFDVSGLTTALALGSSQIFKASATGSNTTGTLTLSSTKGFF